MNLNYLDIAQDFEMMAPDSWKSNSLTERAKIVAKVFVEEDYAGDIKHLINARIENERMKKIEAELKKEKARKQKIERRKKYHLKWSKIIAKAEQYYGDIVYEYCGGGGGESEEEREEVFRKIEMGEFDEEVCRREALYTAFGGQADDPNFYDQAIKAWKKLGW
jgi:hypothetical protein